MLGSDFVSQSFKVKFVLSNRIVKAPHHSIGTCLRMGNSILAKFRARLRIIWVWALNARHRSNRTSLRSRWSSWAQIFSHFRENSQTLPKRSKVPLVLIQPFVNVNHVFKHSEAARHRGHNPVSANFYIFWCCLLSVPFTYIMFKLNFLLL